MNKKGVAVIFSFMMGVVFFLLGLALAGVSTDIVNDDKVMGANGLDCANESISNQDKANCRGTEIIFPIYIAVVFGLAAMMITGILTWINEEMYFLD